MLFWTLWRWLCLQSEFHIGPQWGQVRKANLHLACRCTRLIAGTAYKVSLTLDFFMGPCGREIKIIYSRYPRFGKGELTSEVRWTLGSEIRVSVIPQGFCSSWPFRDSGFWKGIVIQHSLVKMKWKPLTGVRVRGGWEWGVVWGSEGRGRVGVRVGLKQEEWSRTEAPILYSGCWAESLRGSDFHLFLATLTAVLPFSPFRRMLDGFQNLLCNSAVYFIRALTVTENPILGVGRSLQSLFLVLCPVRKLEIESDMTSAVWLICSPKPQAYLYIKQQAKCHRIPNFPLVFVLCSFCLPSAHI